MRELGAIRCRIGPDRLPAPGQTVHAPRYALGLGGKGANQAAAAARLGEAAELVGRVVFRGAREWGFVPAFSVAAVDTVAAGDCFNAGLAAALARGEAMAEAVRFAAACGALATTRPGAAEAAPTREEVAALLG